MENIKELRSFLGETMKALKDGTLNVGAAKTISDLGQVMVNSAKVEADLIIKGKVKTGSDFISGGIVQTGLPEPAKQSLLSQTASIVRPPAEYDNTGHINTAKKYDEK